MNASWRKGFTLVEVLLSVTILSAVAASAAGCFFSGMKLWQRARTESSSRDVIRLELEGLSRDIRGALPVVKAPFVGGSASFSFPALIGGRALFLKYHFDAGVKGLILEASPWPTADVPEPKPNLEKKVLHAEVIRLQYYSQNPAAEGWMSEWPADHSGCPASLRIEGQYGDEIFAKTVSLPAC